MQALFDEIAQALWRATLIAALPLGVTVLVGAVVAMLQAATQIQEQTLTFVPKLFAMGATLFVCTPWIGSLLETMLRAALMAQGD